MLWVEETVARRVAALFELFDELADVGVGLVSWGRDRAAVLEPLSVVAFDGAAFDLDDENARVGDGDDEVAFAFAVGAGADAEGVPGRPSGGEVLG